MERDWCGICRRAAIAMHNRKQVKEREATAKPLFHWWFDAEKTSDPFADRPARPVPAVRPGYEQCLPGGKFLYLDESLADTESVLEQAQRQWWVKYRSASDGGRALMHHRPSFEQDLL